MQRYETTHYWTLKVVRSIHLIMLWLKELSTPSKTNAKMGWYLVKMILESFFGTLLWLVIRSEFLNHAIQISSWMTIIVTKSNTMARVIWKFPGYPSWSMVHKGYPWSQLFGSKRWKTNKILCFIYSQAFLKNGMRLKISIIVIYYIIGLFNF